MSEQDDRYVVWLEDVSRDDVALVGGKSASLGAMTRALGDNEVSVPEGFAVTTRAFSRVLEGSPEIRGRVLEELAAIDHDDFESLFRHAKICRELIRDLVFPDAVARAIASAYEELERRTGIAKIDVAVRSSAVAEDTREASFAGQYESFLGIRGKETVLERCRDCFASMFTARGVDYRHERGIDPDEFDFAATVLRMVRADRACSGILFTLEPESGSRDFVVINAGWGLGEPIVQGMVQPDEYLVFKPTLRKGPEKDPLISHSLGEKEKMMRYAWTGTAETEIIDTPEEERNSFTLNREEIYALARAACTLEEVYGFPLDVEWAKDGDTDELFLVQARAATVHIEEEVTTLERYRLHEEGPVLVRGRAVGSKVASATARVIRDLHGIDRFQTGDVLVTDRTDPDWEPAMKRASGIVTDSGGRTSHAAIVARELGLPCIVGTGDGTAKIPDGEPVTISCVEEEGTVYEGELAFDKEEVDLGSLPVTETKVMLIVGSPSHALQNARLPNDGVGLARQEFIIASQIGIHPRALLELDRVDEEERVEILERTAGYEDPPTYYVENLTEGMARIAAAFYPRDVIVRLTDFKSNEYRGLLGGRHFEPHEENPMIGWRGARRYYDPDYREAFRLECRALIRAREAMGLENIKVMIPFCRTVAELEKTLEVMASFGLERGRDGLQVYLMVEVPSNVILLREFAEHVDGLSIGSNDLTQLALGIDRDGAKLAEIADERDPAVQSLLRTILGTVAELRNEGREIAVGICGQAPSDFPEITRLLVEERIDSISVVSDVAIPTRFHVAECEAELRGASG